MKRALIGGFISLLGTIWGLAIAVAASNNLVSGWTTPPGRFLSTVSQMGFVPLFVMAIVLIVLGRSLACILRLLRLSLDLLHGLLVIIGLSLSLDMLDHTLDLGIRDEAALDTGRLACADG